MLSFYRWENRDLERLDVPIYWHTGPLSWSPDSQEVLFPLYFSVAEAHWQGHSRNKSYFFFCFHFRHSCPCIIYDVHYSQQNTELFFSLPYAHLLHRNILICALTERRKSLTLSLQTQTLLLLSSRTWGGEQKPLSLCLLDHPNTSGLIWSLDCETEILQILVQVQRMAALFGGSQSLRKACHHPAGLTLPNSKLKLTVRPYRLSLWGASGSCLLTLKGGEN